ncbi:hypothetical protein COLO4_08150 [Corchorus olitorius]|uniref:Uncharacterized protein n=1 Tax=Corchorus olitorius TaxID=93759 RepID=A0A1R3KH92_9ROSI|nr:hypothetical protein COLO4_08150 [Corchorus olitorius]
MPPFIPSFFFRLSNFPALSCSSSLFTHFLFYPCRWVICTNPRLRSHIRFNSSLTTGIGEIFLPFLSDLVSFVELATVLLSPCVLCFVYLCFRYHVNCLLFQRGMLVLEC